MMPARVGYWLKIASYLANDAKPLTVADSSG